MEHNELNKHQVKCNDCGELYDMRDLANVCYHSFGECLNGTEMKEIVYSSSKKDGDSILWTKDKTALHLN